MINTRSVIVKSLFFTAVLLGSMLSTHKAEAFDILFALYGDLNAKHTDNKRIDATQALQTHAGSQFSVDLSTSVKHDLFTARGIDPAPGVNKGLAIVYRDGGNIYLHFSYYHDATSIPQNTDYNLGQLNATAYNQVMAALYGDLNASGSTKKSDFLTSIDIVNNNLMDNNTWIIPPASTGKEKHQWFGDPAFGVHKGFLAISSMNGKLLISCLAHVESGYINHHTYQYEITPGPISPPVITTIDVATSPSPTPPQGLKFATFTGPLSPRNAQETTVTPVITYNGLTFWPFSYEDNRYSIGLVAYDSAGNLVSQTEWRGTRYVWDIVLDAPNESVIIKGQSNPDGTIQTSATIPWSGLK